jgi:hypothetical protein
MSRRRRAQLGSSTLLITWMTPFDCMTFGIVTSALSPLASMTLATGKAQERRMNMKF